MFVLRINSIQLIHQIDQPIHHPNNTNTIYITLVVQIINLYVEWNATKKCPTFQTAFQAPP